MKCSAGWAGRGNRQGPGAGKRTAPHTMPGGDARTAKQEATPGGGAGGRSDGETDKQKRAAVGDFERQVEEIRNDAAQVRENLAAAERALEEAGVLRHAQMQAGAGASGAGTDAAQH